MICPNCGGNNFDGAQSCAHCGVQFAAQPIQNQQPQYQAQPQYQQPQYQPQPQYQMQPQYQAQPQYYQPQPQYYQPQPKKDESFGTLAIVMAFLVPLAGLIMGIMGKNDNSYSPETRKKCSSAILIAIIRWVVAFISVIIIYAVYFGFFFALIDY